MGKILSTPKSQESDLIQLERDWRRWLLGLGPDELVVVSRGLARELMTRNLPGATDVLKGYARLAARNCGTIIDRILDGSDEVR